jgi:hypothetical protein
MDIVLQRMVGAGYGEHMGDGLLLREIGSLRPEGPPGDLLDGPGGTEMMLEVGPVESNDYIHATAATPVHMVVMPDPGSGKRDVEIDLLIDLLDPNMPLDVPAYKQGAYQDGFLDRLEEHWVLFTSSVGKQIHGKLLRRGADALARHDAYYFDIPFLYIFYYTPFRFMKPVEHPCR